MSCTGSRQTLYVIKARSSLGCVTAVLTNSMLHRSLGQLRRIAQSRQVGVIVTWPSPATTEISGCRSIDCIMDPLLQPPLRLAAVNRPKSASIEEAKEDIEMFIQTFKQRLGNTTTSESQDVTNSGGVLISQLIQLRNSLTEST